MWWFILWYLAAITHYADGRCPPRYGHAIDATNGSWYFTDNQIFLLSGNQAVTHMEVDRLDAAYILFSDGNRIGLADKNLSTVHNIAGAVDSPGYMNGNGGDTRFNDIWEFTQVNTGLILVADSNNHCIRRIYRTGVTEVTHYSGKCTEHGFLDGASVEARYKNPRAVLHWPRSSYNVYIADSGNNAVRLLRIDITTCSTLTRNYQSSGLHHMAWYNADFLITSPSGLLTYHNAWNSWTNLIHASNTSTIMDGLFKNARLGKPLGLTKLSARDLYALTDEKSIRFIDLAKRTVTTVCSGSKQTLHALLFVGTRLYFGMNNSIAYIEVMKGIRAVRTTPTTTTTTPTPPTQLSTPENIEKTTNIRERSPTSFGALSTPVIEPERLKRSKDGGIIAAVIGIIILLSLVAIIAWHRTRRTRSGRAEGKPLDTPRSQNFVPMPESLIEEMPTTTVSDQLQSTHSESDISGNKSLSANSQEQKSYQRSNTSESSASTLGSKSNVRESKRKVKRHKSSVSANRVSSKKKSRNNL